MIINSSGVHDKTLELNIWPPDQLYIYIFKRVTKNEDKIEF